MLVDFQPIPFVPTGDLAKARAFYLDVLGLEFVEESPFALVVRSGSTQIRVTPVDSPVAQTHTILGWSVPDIQTQLTDLVSRGVTPIRYEGIDQNDLGIWLSPSGAQVAWFRDPDGNTLSLTQL
jgi:catechol 2,3-dioxygenase-like lactoylglutathione lyase family enzyme